jgi:DNA ligase-4
VTPSLVSLFHALAEVKPRRASKHAGSAVHDTRVRDVFARWVAELRRRFLPLPPGTTAIVFRWLFPEQDLRRKYAMQEKRLASQLADALALPQQATTRLMGWHKDARVGCLGGELKQILEERGQVSGNS